MPGLLRTMSTDEVVEIGPDVKVKVVRVHKTTGKVRLQIQAPQELRISPCPHHDKESADEPADPARS